MNKPVIVEKELNASVDKVWKALTDISEMEYWYFEIDEFEPEIGFVFTFLGGEEYKYLHVCKVLKVEPLKKISYSWRYEDFEGDSVVTFELTPNGNKTNLKLTHEGIATFPQNKPDFTVESFTNGWNEIIGIYLKEYVEQPE